MSDQVLKQLLKEERRRSEKRSDKNRDKERRDKQSDREKQGDREKRGEKQSDRDKHSDRDKNRDKEKRDRHSDRDKRSEKRGDKHTERDKIEGVRKNDESIEIVPISSIQPDDGKERFMFLYEDLEGKLHINLNRIEKEAKIFPVYFLGGNYNLTEETVIYREDKWTSEVENSWLEIINNKDENIEILPFDPEDVVVYNGKLFHCQDDLLDYIQNYGCEYLDVVKDVKE